MSKQFTSQPSLQDLIIDRLDKPVPVRGGGTMKDPLDGHEMTTLEMIAYKMTEQAMSGDSTTARGTRICSPSIRSSRRWTWLLWACR